MARVMETENKNKELELLERREDQTSSTGTPATGPATIFEVVKTCDSDSSSHTKGTAETISAGNRPRLHKIRLSGAQRRKLKKAEKIAAGTWTIERPLKTLSEAELPLGDKTGEQPLRDTEGPPNERDGIQESKRAREGSRTPPETLKRPRCFNNPSLQGLYSEGPSELRVVVIDRRHPEITLNWRQANLIQERLVAVMDGTPTDNESPLQFTKTNFNRGVLWMTCANQHTKAWVKGTVGLLGIDGLWEGANVTAVDAKDLPKRPRILFSILGQEEEESVRARLGRQNPGLNVKKWLLLSRKVEEDRMFLVYSIDAASFGALKKTYFEAYYKLGKVTFKALQSADDTRWQLPTY